MGKRLFLAVDVDQATREAIGAIVSAIRERLGPGVKATWVKSDRMHLTLHFFADADAPLETRIRAALNDPISSRPFTVAFAGIGSFPGRGAPRVLWLGLRDGVEPLRRVQDVLAQRLGVSTERDFTPHLTLARFREPVRQGQLAPIADMAAAAGPTLIDRVTLYESRLSPAGPTYTRLAEAVMTS